MIQGGKSSAAERMSAMLLSQLTVTLTADVVKRIEALVPIEFPSQTLLPGL
jgi:hypothetical protein